MQTKQAKEVILYEVAVNGMVTSKAIRLYCEHKISKNTFDKLVSDGIRRFKATNSV